jgi:CIC family chloride channel protein
VTEKGKSKISRPEESIDAPGRETGNAWRGYRLRSLKLFIYAVIIGFLAAVGALVFREAIVLIHGILWPAGDTFLDSFRAAPWWLILALPTAGGLIAGPLIKYLAPEARGAGVSEVILAVTTRHSFIRHRVTFLKAIITSILIGAGASVGREGPIVQIGASVGSSLARFLKLNPELRRVCLAAGAAAGISATFNAPIAGTLFAMEIILMDVAVGYISHIVVASITASVLSRWFWGEFRVFEAMGFEIHHWGELGLYLFLGIAAGAISILFLKSLFGVENAFSRLPAPEWIKPAMGGFMLGAVALAVPEILGVGYDSVNSMLDGKVLLLGALILLLAKLAATSVCIGSGMSGGIFAPSLFIGASIGTIVCLAANQVLPDANLVPANYALVGMGAVVAGTTLAPITAILTIFELTYSYEIILPVMLAAIGSAMFVRLFFGYSVYEMKLLRHGHDIVRGHNVRVLRELDVRDFMLKDFQTIEYDAGFMQVVEKIAGAEFPHFVVRDENSDLVGFLSMRDLRAHLNEFEESKRTMHAFDIMTREVETISENANMEDALHKFEHRAISALPVVDPFDSKKVVGLLRRDDVYEAYEQQILKERLLSTPFR